MSIEEEQLWFILCNQTRRKGRYVDRTHSVDYLLVLPIVLLGGIWQEFGANLEQGAQQKPRNEGAMFCCSANRGTLGDYNIVQG